MQISRTQGLLAIAAFALGAGLLWVNRPAGSTCPPEMALIPGGEFTMGSEEEDEERPPHMETVASFCMDRTEVTVANYLACVTHGACQATVPVSGYCNANKSDRQDHPVNCVDWSQASAYCASVGKRLPEEKEWEYAARGGGEQRSYPWGPAEPGNQLCWSGEGSTPGKGKQSSTCPVGKYPEGDSRWGLHDMAGNVWEWTASRYCPYDSSRDCVKNKYTLRGGGWYMWRPDRMRGAYRAGTAAQDSDDYIGFRCARRAP